MAGDDERPEIGYAEHPDETLVMDGLGSPQPPSRIDDAAAA